MSTNFTTIGNLTKGESYTFNVVAHNLVGNSTVSAAIEVNSETPTDTNWTGIATIGAVVGILAIVLIVAIVLVKRRGKRS